MDIRTFVQNRIMSVIENVSFDQKKFIEGIDAYIEKNAFYELKDSFEDSVIQRVIENNLSDILSGNPREIVLFFSNYLLLEDVRILNNKSFALAKKTTQGSGSTHDSEIIEAEKKLELLLTEIYGSDELASMIKPQVSEIILNLDYAKKASPYYGRRLRDVMIK